MKKNLLAVLVSTMMAAALVVGCGSEAPASAEEVTEVVEETTDEVSDDVCSDETFAELQDCYAITVEIYDAVTELYMSDEIEQNDDIEALLAEAEEVIAEMGEISQDELTEADAADLMDAMADIIEGLGYLVDGMDIAADDVAEMVSDETFEALSECYAELCEDYEIVVEYYLSDDVAADADIEAALEEAGAIIDEIGEISQEDFTEADAEDLYDTMVTLDAILAVYVDAM